jgi:TRAP-type C4-dicarboxylate transport system permease small subunit
MDTQEYSFDVKNLLVKLSRSAVWFLFIGLMVIIFSSGYDILFGAETTHPIWQRHYDWSPLVQDIFLVALSGGVMFALMPELARLRSNQNNQNYQTFLLKPVSVLSNEH